MEGSTEAGGTRDEFLAAAQRLESEAVRSADDGVKDRKRLEEAAELRRRALGPRVYPVLTCSSCLTLTGWLASNGVCDECLRRDQLDAAYADPKSGWISMVDNRAPIVQPPDPPLRTRFAALIGARRALQRAVVRAWRSRVDPGLTGPAVPERGFELEVAHRDEVLAAEGVGLVVRFLTATHFFDGDSWVRLHTTRLSDMRTLTPRTFSAALPIEQLAEAWGDFCADVELFNHETWLLEADRREAEQQAFRARADALREQAGTAALLDEGGGPER